MTTPEHIGRYEIIAELGRGGMATVFRASDPRFGREVAVKVLPAQFVEVEQFRQRFEREARTIAALEHPAIVPVYDFGEEKGQPYLVMKLMSGGSLADRLKQGPLRPDQVAEILTRIAGALDEAHKRGIVHRDLKPGNILFDGYGSAYLSDFGIVRLSESDSTLTGQHTIGTPGYMSPEQIQGEGLDGRSDIYALGVMVFQMLTGELPFSAPTPAMVMVKHITEPVPDVRVLNPDLPPGISQVLTQTMAKNRNDRPATAGEVARLLAVASAASGEAARLLAEAGLPAATEVSPTRAAPPADVVAPSGTPAPTPVRTPTPPPPAAPVGATEILPPDSGPQRPSVAAAAGKRRLPVWLVAGGGLLGLLAILAIVAGVVFFGNQDEDEAGATLTPEVAAEGDGGQAVEPTATTNPAVTAAAALALTRKAEEFAYGNAQERARELVDEAWRALDEERATDVLALTKEATQVDGRNAEAWVVRAFALRDLLDQPGPAAEAFGQAINLEPENFHHYIDRAWTFDQMGDSRAAFEDALRCAEIAPEAPDCALLTGVFAGRLGLVDRALDAFARAEELQPDWVDVALERAYMFESLGDFEAALVDFQRALALDEAEPWRHSDVAAVLNRLGAHEEARDVSQRCVERFPEHASCYLELAVAYRGLGQPQRAAAALEAAADKIADPEALYWLLLDIGYDSLDAGNTLAARDAFERAAEAYPDGADAPIELAWLAFDNDNLRVALEFANRALVADAFNAWGYYVKANVHAALDEPRAAAGAYLRFLDLVHPEDCAECVAEADGFVAEARETAAGLAPSGIRSVSVPGSWNTAVGCSEDWAPACPLIQLEQTADGIWIGAFALPAGEWEVKVALNGAWEVNFGADGEFAGENIPLSLSEPGIVEFAFDPALGWLFFDGADG